MTKEEFQDLTYDGLTKLGYRPINDEYGKSFNGKDSYFCPQTSGQFMLNILPAGRMEVQRIGKSDFSTSLSTRVTEEADFDKLHEEISLVIQSSSESIFEGKSVGCLAIVVLLVQFLVLTYFLVFK